MIPISRRGLAAVLLAVTLSVPAAATAAQARTGSGGTAPATVVKERGATAAATAKTRSVVKTKLEVKAKARPKAKAQQKAKAKQKVKVKPRVRPKAAPKPWRPAATKFTVRGSLTAVDPAAGALTVEVVRAGRWAPRTATIVVTVAPKARIVRERAVATLADLVVGDLVALTGIAWDDERLAAVVVAWPATPPPAEEPPVDEVPADQPPADEPPADQPPADEVPADEPPADQPRAEVPADQPPADEVPADQPPADEPTVEPADG